MPDRPIIFSAPMVRALLAGTKTQTRRVLKPQPAWVRGEVVMWRDTATMIRAHRLPYAPGDRLYVREACHLPRPGVAHLAYRADHPEATGIRWRPSIHMPRWASRITLTVTEVRVQRLQEISEADAKAEGIEQARSGRFYDPTMGKGAAAHLGGMHLTARAAFQTLWNSLHGPDAWRANPWVIAVSFTVRQGNVDA